MSRHSDEPTATIATWNVEWRAPTSRDGVEIRRRIEALDPDIVCLTEASGQFFGEAGHVVAAAPDYGYPLRGDRRKVLLWSRRPWTNVDFVGHSDLPSGRFIRARTSTPLGELDVVGVCIPWSGAHVSTGRRDRKRWDDHIAYLSGLAQILPTQPTRLLVLGDYNQRIPRSLAPMRAYQALEECILSKLRVPTAGPIHPVGAQLIDHIAHSSDLCADCVQSLSNIGGRGSHLTDHIGVSSKLSITHDRFAER